MKYFISPVFPPDAHSIRRDYIKVRLGFDDKAINHKADIALAATKLQINVVELTHLIAEYFSHIEDGTYYKPDVQYDPGSCGRP